MFDGIYGWLRDVAVFFILMTAVLNILPEAKYRKYVQFFLGLVMVVVLCRPILALGNLESELEDMLGRLTLEEEIQGMEESQIQIDGMQQEVLYGAYEGEIENQIGVFLEGKGMEPVEGTAMARPPRGKGEALFTKAFSLRLAWQGCLIGGITLLAYGLGFHLAGTHAAASTMAFATLTLSQLFHAFDVRSEDTPLFRLGWFSNPAMNRAFLAGAALQGAVLLAPPLQGVFAVVPMDLAQWGIVLGLAVTPLVVCEIEKALRRARAGRRAAREEKSPVYR